MFSHKTTIRITIAQYAVLLGIYVLYGYFFHGTEDGQSVSICALICLLSSILVSWLVKKEDFIISYIFATGLIAIWYFSTRLDGPTCCFLPMIAATIVMAIYLNFWRNIVFFMVSDFVLLLNAIVTYRLPKDTHQVFLFSMLFLVYNFASVTLCMLVYFIEKRMEMLEEKTNEALSASESKGNFLANMSHEIRTPMNAIHGLNQLILQEQISDDVRDKALGIQTASSDLLTIINDILDFSKIESGKLEIIETEYDIKDVISDVVNLVYLRTEEHNVEFLVDCDSYLPKRLYGDEIRIKQVIMNLLTNAVKFTKKGYVKLTINFEYQGEEVILRIDVEDTGIGIQKNALDRLFDSFEQVDTKKNRKVEGTGLGLAISKQLVVLMNGNISVQSEYGKGSTFSIAIPQKVVSKEPIVEIANKELKVLIYMESDVCQQVYERMFSMLEISCIFTTEFSFVEEYANDREMTHFIIAERFYDKHRDFFIQLSKQAQVVVTQERSSNINIKEGIKTVYRPFYLLPLEAVLNGEQTYGVFSKEDVWDFEYVAPEANILVVDDNDVNLRVTVGFMKPLKMQITTANSGKKAIELMQQQRFDLVFMDHMMPEMDGVETTKMIRNLSKEKWDYYDTVPIVALTANAIGGAREMFLANGFQDFLAKPMELRELDRVIRKWLPVGCLINKTVYMANCANVETASAMEVEAGSHTAALTSWPEAIPGLDLEIARHYFGDDIPLFVEVLSSFYTASIEKAKVLKDAFEKQDWACYALESHALKSSSKSIGAMSFSEQALEMEMASKALEVHTIEEKHETFMAALSILTEQIRPFASEEENEDLLPLMRMKELKSRVTQLMELAAILGDEMKTMSALDSMDKIVKDSLKYRYSRDNLKEAMKNILEVIDSRELEEIERQVTELAKELKL